MLILRHQQHYYCHVLDRDRTFCLLTLYLWSIPIMAILVLSSVGKPNFSPANRQQRCAAHTCSLDTERERKSDKNQTDQFYPFTLKAAELNSVLMRNNGQSRALGLELLAYRFQVQHHYSLTTQPQSKDYKLQILANTLIKTLTQSIPQTCYVFLDTLWMLTRGVGNHCCQASLPVIRGLTNKEKDYKVNKLKKNVQFS